MRLSTMENARHTVSKAQSCITYLQRTVSDLLTVIDLSTTIMKKPSSSLPVQASSSANFSNELINTLARLEAEKMIAAQNANVQFEQIPFGET